MADNNQPNWDGQDRRKQIYTQPVPSRFPSWAVAVGTLLLNIVVLWTPLTIYMSNRVGELESLRSKIQKYEDDKIAQRVNTLEADVKAAMLISNRYHEDKVPTRLIELEMYTKQMLTQLADHPHRVTMLENEVKRLTADSNGIGPRVTALEVLIKSLDKDTEGIGPRVIALELDHKIIAEELKSIPNRMLIIEQTVDRGMKQREVLEGKVATLEHSEWINHQHIPAAVHNSYNGGGP